MKRISSHGNGFTSGRRASSSSSVNSNDQLLQKIESRYSYNNNSEDASHTSSVDTLDLFDMLDRRLNGNSHNSVNNNGNNNGNNDINNNNGINAGHRGTMSVSDTDRYSHRRKKEKRRWRFSRRTSSKASKRSNGYTSEASYGYASEASSVSLGSLPSILEPRGRKLYPPPYKRRASDIDEYSDDDEEFECCPEMCSDAYIKLIEHWRQFVTISVAAVFLFASLYNMSNYQHSLGFSIEYATTERTMSEEQKRTKDTVAFKMCDRETPFRYDINPLLPPLDQKPLNKFENDWPKQNKILLLRNDGKFGHIGNQVNALLHAFDYARDNKLEIGMLFHSWAMDVIHTMFYETDDFDVVSSELLEDLGIKVIRNQTQLESYDEVISQNSQQLYFYKSSNSGMDHWRETMGVHISIMQRLYLRYNRGYGYIHNGLRAKDLCATLDMFFHERVGEVKYSVIHSRYLDGNAEWRLEKMAKTTGLTIEGGAITMGPAYIKSILKPLGMLEYPIILITDGQLPSVERGLLNDETIGSNIMVLSNKISLDSADVALAVLADVFIGNPASVTSGFIARSRVALGYSEKSTQLFRRKRIHQWYSVCNEECVFNPWILGQWV